MPEDLLKKTVAVCDTQPVSAEGLRNLIAGTPDLMFLEPLDSLSAATRFVHDKSPSMIVVDKAYGMRAVLDWIHEIKLGGATTAVVIWGVSMTEAEALRLLQAGARGIVRKT